MDQAEAMWSSPCAICGFFAAGQMVIDHCHGSGKVRGTLCHPCNVSIGHFLDDVGLLEKAAEYLRSFGNKPSADLRNAGTLTRTRFRTNRSGRKPRKS
jgi:hypothetical protein